MFDPTMLMNMLGGMNNMGGMPNFNMPNQPQNSDDATQNPTGATNNLFNMLGANPQMLTSLMQMFGANGAGAPPTGKNVYVSDKLQDNKNINSELYRIIKDAENIY